MADEQISVKGTRDLHTAFRRVDRDLPKELAEARAVEAKIVANYARTKVPLVTGRARSSVRSKQDRRGGSIVVGGPRVSYFPWLDFGGRVGRGKSVERAFIKEGRYLYPSLKDKRAQGERNIDKRLQLLAISAGFETKGRVDG